MSDAAALIPTQGTDYTAALSAPSLDNLRRIGGEMFSWTDRDPRRGPQAPRGAVLRHLLGEHGGADRSVLIAGPIADDLVATLVEGGATVTWLVRSLADAEEAARTHPRVTVLAGALGGTRGGGGAPVAWLGPSLAHPGGGARTHPRVPVLAGAAVKVGPADRFDLVVAVDGVERLNSAEGDQLSAADLIDRLAEA